MIRTMFILLCVVCLCVACGDEDSSGAVTDTNEVASKVVDSQDCGTFCEIVRGSKGCGKYSNLNSDWIYVENDEQCIEKCLDDISYEQYTCVTSKTNCTEIRGCVK